MPACWGVAAQHVFRRHGYGRSVEPFPLFPPWGQARRSLSGDRHVVRRSRHRRLGRGTAPAVRAQQLSGACPGSAARARLGTGTGTDDATIARSISCDGLSDACPFGSRVRCRAPRRNRRAVRLPCAAHRAGCCSVGNRHKCVQSPRQNHPARHRLRSERSKRSDFYCGRYVRRVRRPRAGTGDRGEPANAGKL